MMSGCRGRSSAAKLASLVLLSCSGRTLRMPASDGDLVIVASLGADGEGRHLELFRGTEGVVTQELDRPGEFFAAFVVPSARIAPRDPGALDGVVPVWAEDRGIGCGRCLLGEQLGVLAPLPGDVCPLPSWTTTFAEPEAAELAPLAARRVFLSFGRECGCRATSDESEVSIEARLAFPAGGLPPRTHAAVLADGTVGLVSRTDALLVGTDGAVQAFAGSPDGRSVLSMAASPEHFLVAREGTRRVFSELELRDRNMSIQAREQLDAEVSKVVYLPSPGVFAILGRRESPTQASSAVASLIVCELSHWSCKEISPPRPKERFADATVLQNGRLIALQTRPGFVIFERAPKPGEVLSIGTTSMRTTTGDIGIEFHVLDRWDNSGVLVSSGNQIYICGGRGAEPARVLTASIAGGPVELRELGRFPGRACAGSQTVRSNVALVLTDGASDLQLELADGQIVSREQVEGGSRWIRSENGRALMLDQWLRIHTVDVAGGRRLIYGDPAFPMSEGRLVSHGGAAWLIDESRRARLGAEETVIEGSFGQPVRALASDGELLYAAVPSGVLSMDASTGEVGDFVGKALLPDRWDSWAPTMAATGPGELLVAAAGDPPTLLRLRRGSAVEVVLEWDDPTTFETDPPRGLVSMSRFSSSMGVSWLAASTGRVDELSAPEGGLLRLVPWLDPPVATHFRVDAPQAVVAECPDRVRAFSRDSLPTSFFTAVDLDTQDGDRTPRPEVRSSLGSYGLRSATPSGDGRTLVTGEGPTGNIVFSMAPAGGWLELEGSVDDVIEAGGAFWARSPGGRVFEVKIERR